MSQLREVLEEEELIKRIASLPDKEGRERVLQTIEDMEKRERIRKRVEELRMKMKEEKLRPIDREVITGARWGKKLAPFVAVSFLSFALFILINARHNTMILVFLPIMLIAAILAYYLPNKWYDEVVEKYYRKD